MNKPISPKHRRAQQTPYSKFLQSLDRYQSDTSLTHKQCHTLHQMMHLHYQAHFSPYIPSTCDDQVTSTYLQWQNDHEMSLDSLEKIRVHRVAPKEKVHIDMRVNTLDDLISIMDTHPYTSQKEYNIDLQALHKIKGELTQIANMVGLESLKKSILKQLLYFIQGFADDGAEGDYKHTVLTGPPGTGKTELAKLMGTMYSKVGVLKSNTFKKVTRTDLVAGYLGQTAIKTRKVIDECMGGVLFIDEAYSLQPDDMYAKECVDTLCEALSDHRKDLMVIIAGYQENLHETFFKINSGLSSRFVWRFNIDAYSAEELHCIFNKMVEQRTWHLDENVKPEWFREKKDQFIDNGRSMEQLFLLAKISHAKRVYGQDESLKKKLTSEDVIAGYRMYEENMKSKDNKNMLFGLYI